MPYRMCSFGQDGIEMNVYCLFCNSTKCESVASQLSARIGCRAISPKIVQRKWVKGKCVEEINDYLPGYVFLYTEKPIREFRKMWTVEGVLRLLGRREEGYRLSGGDLRFANMICANDGVIGIIKAYEEGDRIKLTDESLPGYEGDIIKVDRRKGRAQILVRFDSKEVKLWVGFDLISKVPDE